MITSRTRLVLFACPLTAALALPAAADASPPKRLYVSLGDSYASGYQPTGVGQGRNTRNGFAIRFRAWLSPAATG